MFWIVDLPPPNTEKNHPKWDLGKDFSSQAFIEIKKGQNPSTSINHKGLQRTANEYAGERVPDL